MMKRCLLPLSVLCGVMLAGCAPLPGRAQVQHLSVYSRALKKTMKVNVYLPPGYTGSKSYPVLYILHGMNGTPNSWFSGRMGSDSVHLDKDATRLINEGSIQPLIIVAPEIDNSYGINTSPHTHAVGHYNRGMYETYLNDDVIPYIDQHYSVIHNASGRYIGGLSMGGFAALHDAFTHPQTFSKVGVMSAALWKGGLPAELQWIYPNPQLQAKRDPITIAQKTKVGMPVLMLEGKSDPFLQGDEALAAILKRQGADIQYNEYPGGHNYTFWSDHADQLLRFFVGSGR